MQNFKPLNKYPILTAADALTEHSIALKFTADQYFDTREDIFILTITGNNIAQSIELIKEHNLNTETVVVDDTTELTFYIGNMNESPDWGDWTSYFSLNFEQYTGEFAAKTQKDWNDELIYLLANQVKTKAFRAVTEPAFREQKSDEIKKLLNTAQLNTAVKEKLSVLLNKINALDSSDFYNIFLKNYKMND
ncbi:MAG: hypothetical protein QM791_06580 [Ferruginibacter sp.]